MTVYIGDSVEYPPRCGRHGGRDGVRDGRRAGRTWARMPSTGGGVAGGGRWWQEFNAMDENMTEHLVNVQQQALQLAMVVQRIEDGQNSAAGQSGESSTEFMGS